MDNEVTYNELSLNEMIRNMVTRIKPYAKLDMKMWKIISEYEKYEQAWEDFKEYNSHIRSALLERFMV